MYVFIIAFQSEHYTINTSRAHIEGQPVPSYLKFTNYKAKWLNRICDSQDKSNFEKKKKKRQLWKSASKSVLFIFFFFYWSIRVCRVQFESLTDTSSSVCSCLASRSSTWSQVELSLYTSDIEHLPSGITTFSCFPTNFFQWKVANKKKESTGTHLTQWNGH